MKEKGIRYNLEYEKLDFWQIEKSLAVIAWWIEKGENKMEKQQPEVLQTEQRIGFHPFYLCPIFYVLSVYLMPLFASMQEGSILFYFIFLPFIFGVVNIIAAIKFCKLENRNMMFNATVLVKYATIPFFIVGGLIVAASFLLSFIPVPFMIFLGPMVALAGIFVGWLILALEAPYAISYFRLSKKAKVYSCVMVVIHTILQFFFTLDVIDVMILTIKERKWKKFTIFIIILFAVAMITVFVLISFATVKTINHMS